MSTLYENIKSLCDEYGVSGAKLCNEIGASKSLLTGLKMGRSKTITTETAQKIADYFGVSVDRVLGTEQQKKPAPIAESELDNKLIKMLVGLSPDEIKQVDAFVQGLIAARKA